MNEQNRNQYLEPGNGHRRARAAKILAGAALVSTIAVGVGRSGQLAIAGEAFNPFDENYKVDASAAERLEATARDKVREAIEADQATESDEVSYNMRRTRVTVTTQHGPVETKYTFNDDNGLVKGGGDLTSLASAVPELSLISAKVSDNETDRSAYVNFRGSDSDPQRELGIGGDAEPHSAAEALNDAESIIVNNRVPIDLNKVGWGS